MAGSMAGSGAGRSKRQRTKSPKMSGWSMVWLAPVWRNSGGRSAVSRIMGTPSVEASTTAGKPFATAVPEVVIQAAGRPVSRAYPRAAKAVPRSSKWTRLWALSLAARAATSGVEREPGATQKNSTPQRISSSTIRFAQRRLTRGVSLFKPEHPGEVGDLVLDLGPLLVRYGAGDDPRSRVKVQRPPPNEPRPDADSELRGLGTDPTDGAGVEAPIEGFEFPDLRQRPIARMTTDGGCRMQRLQQSSVGNALLEDATHPRPQVPTPRQLHLGDITVDLQFLAKRRERLTNAGAYEGVLGEVFRTVQQIFAQPFVVLRRQPAWPRPRHGLAHDHASVAAEQTLGRGPEERHTTLRLGVEMEAVGRGLLQPFEDQRGIEIPIEADLGPAGEHDLPQTPLREGAERPLDVLPPSSKVGAVFAP